MLNHQLKPNPVQDPNFCPNFHPQIKLNLCQDPLNHKEDLMFLSLPSAMDYLQPSLVNQDLHRHSLVNPGLQPCKRSDPDQVNLQPSNQDLKGSKHDLHQDLLPDLLHRVFSKDLNNLELLNHHLADLVQGQSHHQLDFQYLTQPH